MRREGHSKKTRSQGRKATPNPRTAPVRDQVETPARGRGSGLGRGPAAWSWGRAWIRTGSRARSGVRGRVRTGSRARSGVRIRVGIRIGGRRPATRRPNRRTGSLIGGTTLGTVRDVGADDDVVGSPIDQAADRVSGDVPHVDLVGIRAGTLAPLDDVTDDARIWARVPRQAQRTSRGGSGGQRHENEQKENRDPSKTKPSPRT